MSLSKCNTTIVCTILIAIAICGLTPKSNADIIHESANMGPTNQYPGVAWIFEDQFLGSRFEITEPTEITAIGGHIGSENDLLIFGAIVWLDDKTDFPSNTYWMNNLVKGTWFRPPSLSADIRIPLSVVLEPGWYGLIFGAGDFGSPNHAVAFMPGGGQSRYLGASYFHYNGAAEMWFNTLYDTGDPRFVVEGQSIIPPVEIYGTKFNDVDGDGVWDAGEPAMTGWEFYLDTNENGSYDIGEPNSVVDPNGMYSFENLDAPATYHVREIMKDGWAQTLPGGPDNEYVISTEPNNIYGPCDFGNTTLPQGVTLSGYVTWEDGTPYPGITIDLDLDGNPFTAEKTATTDNDGFYEFSLTAPWTGMAMIRLPDRWISHWPTLRENVTADIVEDFTCFYQYDAGSGTESDPYQIRTAQQLLMIRHQGSNSDDDFVLTSDIDLTGTTHSSAIIPSFGGQFDGAGFSVLNLQSNSGLFGYIKNAVIKNLGVENVEITNAGIAGPLCHSNHGGTIENCFSTGNISGFYDVGGLCAWAHTEYLDDDPPIGGPPLPPVNTPVIKNCYSTVNVTLIHPDSLPGFSTGSAGGLCAYTEGAELFNNYACGSVDGTGCDTPFGFDIVIDNGGLVGHIENCNVYNNYSSGYVVDNLAYSNPGGFCGLISGEPTNFSGNFWDNTVNPSLQGIGNATDPDVTGESTVSMQTESTFADAGWDFVDETANGTEDIWRMPYGIAGSPILWWQRDIPGDWIGKYGVGIEDFAVLAASWMNIDAEINLSGPDIIDFEDLTVFLGNWSAGR
ncbi:MAG: hypothetical protein J7M40_15035 [Planctomycetes bacterium]|nr:hypothetical protein [Planctomycetota bacterium]